MTRSRWPAIVLAALVGAIITMFVTGFPNQRNTDPNLEKVSERSSALLSQRIDELSASYKKGDSMMHLQTTLSTLRLINRTSIRALLPEINKLEKAISKDGLAPYISIAMEIAHRLGRNRNTIMQEHYSKLASAALNSVEKSDSEVRFIVLVKEKGRRSYRQYDEDTGRAVARLVFSEFGRAQFQKGQWPSDVVRTTTMLVECKEEEDGNNTRSAAAKKDCIQFVGLVADKLKESGQSGITPGIMDDFGHGTTVSRFDCFAGELAGQEMIDSVETFAACMTKQAGTPSQWHLDGSSISSTWSGEAPEMEGYEHVPPSKVEYFSGPNGATGTQVTHEYENDSGGKAARTDYSVIDGNGEEDGGTQVNTDDGNGNTSEELFDAQGQSVASFSEDPNGNTVSVQKTPGGGSVEVSTDSETGVSTIEVTDADGNTTTATVAEDGSCTGAACDADIGSSASTPVDDNGWAPACAIHSNDPRVPDNSLTTDPLGPYIYPSPDSSEDNPLLACLSQSIASNDSESQCPPSVALCLEPPPPGSCECGKGRANEPLPSVSMTCNQIQCADGSQCDPATGVCSSITVDGIFGGYSPGVNPPGPLPIFRLEPE